MKKNFLYGIVLALSFFMCGASWALPADTVVSMVTSPDYEVDTGTPMCNVIVPAGTVAMACRLGSTSVAYFQLTNYKVTDNKMACGFVSELDDVPTKVPIAV